MNRYEQNLLDLCKVEIPLYFHYQACDDQVVHLAKVSPNITMEELKTIAEKLRPKSEFLNRFYFEGVSGICSNHLHEEVNHDDLPF